MMKRIFQVSLTCAALGSAWIASNAQAAKVAMQPLSALVVYPTYAFPAEIVAHTETLLSSELNARLTGYDVRPGASVVKGQVLAKLDCRDTEDALALNRHRQVEAKAQLKLAKLQLQRFKNLEKQQYTATSQIDESSTQVESLQANIAGLMVEQRTAERAVERCVIRAPFNAVVTDLSAGDGQWMSIGTPLMTLVRSDRAEIKVDLPLALANGVKAEMAEWRTRISPPQSIPWLRQSAVLVQNQRMASVWYAAPDEQPIGLAGEVVLKDQQAHLPSQYIVMRKGQLGAFVAEKGKAVFKPLSGAQVGRPALIPENWSSQWNLVVEGQQRLHDGEVVTP